MVEEKIGKNDADMLMTAIKRILSSEVLERAINNQLPLTIDLTDSNKIYQGKASVLFVDMRESTKLPERFSTDQLVKIYRGYIRTVVQAIRYSGGTVKDFMGDGVLAVFIDDEEGKSEVKAVHAARYITTAIDIFLNPALDQKMNYRISCGIGVHTGNICLSKVGMRGREQQNDAESEYGIAWIGESTNLACKYSGAVDCGSIFISSSTYIALSNILDKQKWSKVEIAKGSNILTGYVAEHYYLPLDTEITPCSAEAPVAALSFADELRNECQQHLSAIERKAVELGKREQMLLDREQRLNAQVSTVKRKEEELHSIEQEIGREKYEFYCSVLDSGHCKKSYVLEMGKAFWEEYLSEAIQAGVEIGKDVRRVKQEISYAMVSIYEDLELYDKAYDFLVEQAAGYAWLNVSTVKKIVTQVGYCDELKSAVYSRLFQNDLPTDERSKFEEIKNWLVFEFKKD